METQKRNTLKRLGLLVLIVAGCFAQSSIFCPVCLKLKLTSKVYPESPTSTLSYAKKFYDEAGAYHIHDENTTRTEFSCSRGHVWATRVAAGTDCPRGDFKPSQKDVLEIINDGSKK